MELFFSRMSGNSSRAVFGLLELGVDWTPRPLDASAGETRGPDYLALNPMGKIPTLRDGDFVLWESNAINWYVAESHPEAGLLPASPSERAAVQRWMLFQTGHVSPSCLAIVRTNHPAMRAFWKFKADPAAAQAAEKELARYLPVLDAALSGKEWLEGKFSLADVAQAPHLWLLKGAGFDFQPYPRLAGWLDRLFARPAWKKAEQMVFGSA
jgi:glutathione S-transferase